jgi:hypothetical protein
VQAQAGVTSCLQNVLDDGSAQQRRLLAESEDALLASLGLAPVAACGPCNLPLGTDQQLPAAGRRLLFTDQQLPTTQQLPAAGRRLQMSAPPPPAPLGSNSTAMNISFAVTFAVPAAQGLGNTSAASALSDVARNAMAQLSAMLAAPSLRSLAFNATLGDVQAAYANVSGGGMLQLNAIAFDAPAGPQLVTYAPVSQPAVAPPPAAAASGGNTRRLASLLWHAVVVGGGTVALLALL